MFFSGLDLFLFFFAWRSPFILFRYSIFIWRPHRIPIDEFTIFSKAEPRWFLFISSIAPREWACWPWRLTFLFQSWFGIWINSSNSSYFLIDSSILEVSVHCWIIRVTLHWEDPWQRYPLILECKRNRRNCYSDLLSVLFLTLIPILLCICVSRMFSAHMLAYALFLVEMLRSRS